MTQPTKHVSITEHKGWLAIEYHTDHSVEGEIVSPFDTGNFGTVVSDVKHVGCSREAYEFLKTLRPGYDDLGEIDMFKSGDKHVFGTIGGRYVLINKNSEPSSQWELPAFERFQEIPNSDMPQGAKDAIEEAVNS